MSIGSVTFVRKSIEIRNVELIQELCEGHWGRNWIWIHTETGELSADIKTINNTSWIILASLTPKFESQTHIFKQKVSHTFLVNVRGTLRALKCEDVYQTYKEMQASPRINSPRLLLEKKQNPLNEKEEFLIVYFLFTISKEFEKILAKTSREIAPREITFNPLEHRRKQIQCIAGFLNIFKIENRVPTTSLKSRRTARNICLFIEENLPFFKATVLKTGKNLYIKSFHSKEPHIKYGPLYSYGIDKECIVVLRNYHLCERSIQYNTDDSIYIHFTKKKQEKDSAIGQRGGRVISMAMRYDQLEDQANASCGTLNEREVEAFKKLGQLKGVVKLLYYVSYFVLSKDPAMPDQLIKKTRLITKVCSGDSLKKAVYKKTLTLADKKTITKQLVETVLAIHKQKWFIRDLSATKIFLEIVPNQGLQIKINDLSGACSETDTESLLRNETRPIYTPPEMALILRKYRHYLNISDLPPKAEEELKNIKYESYDIWGLGCILYELLLKPLPWVRAYQTNHEKEFSEKLRLLFNQIIFEDLRIGSSNKQSILYFLDRLLQNSFENRFTIQEAFLWVRRHADRAFDSFESVAKD